MSEVNNNQPASIGSTRKPKENLPIIIIGSILIVVILIGGVWFFVQKKNTQDSSLTEQPNKLQQDNQYNNQDQPKEDLNSVSQNFEEKIEGELKVYTNFSKGIQFAYNKAWQANKEEFAQNPDNLLFSNLPEGDYLSFNFVGGPVGPIFEENKILQEDINENGFKYQIIRSFEFGGPEEKSIQEELIYLQIKHTINDQLEQQGVYSGMLYRYVYIFPKSKGESYLNRVVSELETIAKSFKYLYNAPYFVNLPSGKKLAFEHTINFKLTSDQDGIVTLSAKDYDLKVKLYYNKPVDINTTCLSVVAKYPIKFATLVAEYRVYENSKIQEPQCNKVSGMEIIEVSLNGEKVFLEFTSSFSTDDKILLLTKSMKIQS